MKVFSNSEKLAGKNTKWVLQEFIEGDEYCVYAIADAGIVRGISIYSNQKSSFNVSLYFEAHESSQIVDWVKHIIAKIKFTGNISFDLIQNENGVIYPIECNPRITSGIHLFNGFENLADLFVHGARIAPVLCKKTQKSSALSLLLLFDFKSALNFNQRLKLVIKSRDVLFKFNDPFPAFGQIISFTYLAFLMLKQHKSLTKVSMWDIEYNGD